MTENEQEKVATRKILKRNYEQVTKMMELVNERLNRIAHDQELASNLEYRALEKVFWGGEKLCTEIQTALDLMDKGA